MLDLGCFDPAGFRGWSGGARDSFVIAEFGATPGYLAGPVTAGLWQVVIGLHLVPAVRPSVYRDRGVVVGRLAIPRRAACHVAGGAGRARRCLRQARAAPALPAEPGLTWLAGDLHAHTFHSDGAMSVAELAAHAVERGLDFVAVTDHNTVSHHGFSAPLLPGTA